MFEHETPVLTGILRHFFGVMYLTTTHKCLTLLARDRSEFARYLLAGVFFLFAGLAACGFGGADNIRLNTSRSSVVGGSGAGLFMGVPHG